MPDYGVTENGFVLKRMDTILEEVHADLTDGFGFDTRQPETSFLNVLVTTFCNQIAELWETAQNSYYAKYPATATGVNLDNAVQYGGIRRTAARKTCYPLHCTGDDGTAVPAGVRVSTDTNPRIFLTAAGNFQITREAFNEVRIIVSAVETDSIYRVRINGNSYFHLNHNGDAGTIAEGLKNALNHPEYHVTLDGNVLCIADTDRSRKNRLILSDNLTTESVTVIADFETEEYGKITLPDGIITQFADNIAGFDAVTNLLEPVYGRLQETDIELRQSYIAKSALRSNTMLESISAELLNNVTGVESASGYENCTSATDERGLPPHSIEMVVEGGDADEIAAAILRRKAGGIQTYGSITVNVPGLYGDFIPVSFNRPEYLHVRLKVVLHGSQSLLPSNFPELVKASLMSDLSAFTAGTDLIVQLLDKGIYERVAGLTFVEIKSAYTLSGSEIPAEEDYKSGNIIVDSRQKIVLDSADRIEVSFVPD